MSRGQSFVKTYWHRRSYIQGEMAKLIIEVDNIVSSAAIRDLCAEFKHIYQYKINSDKAEGAHEISRTKTLLKR